MEYFAASVTGVFGMVLILILIYFGVRLLARILMPSGKQRPGDRFRHGSQRERDNRREGEVRIEYTDDRKGKNKSKKSKGGEYVDYEEVD